MNDLENGGGNTEPRLDRVGGGKGGVSPLPALKPGMSLEFCPRWQKAQCQPHVHGGVLGIHIHRPVCKGLKDHVTPADLSTGGEVEWVPK